MSNNLEFEFKDFDESLEPALYPHKKWPFGKGKRVLTAEQADDAIHRAYGAVTASNDSSRFAIQVTHKNEEKHQKEIASYEVQMFPGDARASSLGTLLEDAIVSKPEGMDEFDRLVLQLTGSMLDQKLSVATDDDSFPDGADDPDMPAADDGLTDESPADVELADEDDLTETAENQEVGAGDEDDVSEADDAFGVDMDDEDEELPTTFDDPLVDSSEVAASEESDAGTLTAAPVPAAATLLDFRDFTVVPPASTLVTNAVSREAVLAGLGLSADATDELTKRKVAKAMELYDASSAASLMRTSLDLAAENEIKATDLLKDAYHDANEVDPKDQAIKNAAAVIEQHEADEQAKADADIAQYQSDAETQKASIDDQVQQKIDAYAAQAKAEASKDKEQIDAETVNRRDHRNEQLADALNEFRTETIRSGTDKVITARNADLTATRNATLATYLSGQSDLAKDLETKAAGIIDQSREAFSQVEADYAAEQKAKHELELREQANANQARMAEETKRANDLAAENNRLKAEQTKQLKATADANLETMAKLPIGTGAQQESMNPQILELTKAMARLEARNEALTKGQTPATNHKGLIAGIVTAVVLATGLGGAGYVALSHVGAQQQATTAKLERQLAKVSQPTADKASLADLIAAGKYTKAAKEYSSQAAINQITAGIFANGTVDQLKSFVAAHPSAFGKLDLAILNKDNADITAQYNALSASEKAQMSTAQQNAVKAAQSDSSSTTSTTATSTSASTTSASTSVGDQNGK